MNILTFMESDLVCEYCHRSSWKNKKGLGYHQSFCKDNPNRLPSPKKSDAFYEAMKARRGSAANQWSDVDWDHVPFDELGFQKRRERLLKESNHSCIQCGFSKTRECGGSILEIDHIDGDHTNNCRENLRVLCPNCHALTPNFRNWGRSNKKTSGRFRKGNKGYDS